MDKRRYFVRYESKDDPKDSNDSWNSFPAFGFRMAWRLYTSVNAEGETKTFRDYRSCFEMDLDVLEPLIIERFGPVNGRWALDQRYLYIYVRSAADFAEFRLSIDFPED